MQAKLLAGDGEALDRLGFAVAVDGDTAVVSSAYHDGERGAAYVFARTGTSWTQQVELVAGDAQPGDTFGNLFSLSLRGDILAVAAVSADVLRGSVYTFEREGTVWTQQAKLTASDGASFDVFGKAVAFGAGLLLVGAPGVDGGGSDQHGAVYPFSRTGSAWQQLARLSTSATEPEAFGVSVAGSSQRFAVSALSNRDFDNPPSGAVYIYRDAVATEVPTLSQIGALVFTGALGIQLLRRTRASSQAQQQQSDRS